MSNSYLYYCKWAFLKGLKWYQNAVTMLFQQRDHCILGILVFFEVITFNKKQFNNSITRISKILSYLNLLYMLLFTLIISKLNFKKTFVLLKLGVLNFDFSILALCIPKTHRLKGTYIHTILITYIYTHDTQAYMHAIRLRKYARMLPSTFVASDG